MLILSRKIGEEIVSDGPMRVKVLDIQGDRVRYGIDAEKNVRVRRGEAADEPRRPKDAPLRKDLNRLAAVRLHDCPKDAA